MDPIVNNQMVAARAIMIKEAIEAISNNRDVRNLTLLVPELGAKLQELHHQCCEILRSLGIDPGAQGQRI